MKDLCTILVNSCDNYEDCWDPFFTLLKKYWLNIKYPIILNTESKSYSFPGLDIRTFNLYSPKDNVVWGKRMIDTLNLIKSKYIIFFLDDFFLEDYVDEEKLQDTIRWMEENSKIAVFSFNLVEENKYKDIISDKYKGFALRNKKGPYRFNCQIAVWRRETLLKTLRKYENPWEWEVLGNYRSRRMKEEFYTLYDKHDMLFKYNIYDVGMTSSKWKMPGTKELFEKEKIIIDYSIRNEKEKVARKRTIYIKIRDRIVKYYIKARSII